MERSLAGPGGYGLAAYEALLRADPRMRLTAAPLQAVADSLTFAAATTLIAGSLGLLAALVVGYRRGWLARGLDALVMLPLGTSAVIVGFGFLVSLDTPPLDLRTSVLLIPIAHALIALPFVMRAVVPVIRSIDDRLREAAAVLGASPVRAWREVDAPILARGALVGAGFAFAVSLGEFGATLFIARPDSVTIPVAIYRLLGQPGAANFATAMALAVVLMVLTATAVLLIERLARQRAATVLGGHMLEIRGPQRSPTPRADVLHDVSLRVRRASCSACWVPVAAASRRCCASSPGWSGRDAAVCCSRVSTWQQCRRTSGAWD